MRQAILNKDFPKKVSHQKGKIIAKPGDRVKVVSLHGTTGDADCVAIVELSNKERIPVHEKYLKYVT